MRIPFHGRFSAAYPTNEERGPEDHHARSDNEPESDAGAFGFFIDTGDSESQESNREEQPREHVRIE